MFSIELVVFLEISFLFSPCSSLSVDLDIVDRSGWSPLIHAAFNGHLQMVQEIVSFQERKYEQEHGEALLSEEEGGGLKWKQCLKRFLRRKGKYNGSTALHLCCARGHESITKLILNKMINEYALSPSESINATDYDLATPLHCAVLGKHYDITTLLLMNGAAINKPDIRGKTPLDWAKERGLSKFVSLFKQYEESNASTNPFDSDLDILNDDDLQCMSLFFAFYNDRRSQPKWWRAYGSKAVEATSSRKRWSRWSPRSMLR